MSAHAPAPAETVLPELSEAETLTNDLKRLLVRSEQALDREGVRQQVETVERWLESYRRGISAAHKLSESGTPLLHQVRDCLNLSLAELCRLEDEGGMPMTKEQTAQAEDLRNALRRIDQLLPSVEGAFQSAPEESGEKTST